MAWAQIICAPEEIGAELDAVASEIDAGSLRVNLFGRVGDPPQALVTFQSSPGTNMSWVSTIVDPEWVSLTLNAELNTIDVASLRVISYSRIRGARSFDPKMIVIYGYT